MLWCEYPMRLFSLHIYKGNEKKLKKRGKGALGYKGNRGMGIYLAHAQGQVC
jgi:hypothetical protein